ncbi:MAG: site-specific DNA-methyltransferase [Ignavibacteriales bacterium]|nr:site-specific DNA-methyltransferase [Ignavibacterium sp.]MCZ2268796.1 site-specific DNA-methyltransferase [Ignavibacteriales bacterium]HMN18875.1 DNA methyltransferase [Ignavibacteriaceae bacterium]
MVKKLDTVKTTRAKKTNKNKTQKKEIYSDYKHNTLAIKEKDPLSGSKLDIRFTKTCECKPTHINCLTASQWIKQQLGVWEFYYEKRDIRDKKLHPATFPISLSKRIIELFSHQGELVVDPFVGSGTTLLAAQDTNRNAVGFDLKKDYIDLAYSRLNHDNFFNDSKQIAIQDDARNIRKYLEEESVSLIWTSPPYGNLLNRARKNKSRRDRNNEQLGKIEQYSQDDRDLGTYELEKFTKAMGDIFEGLLPLLKEKSHCVINIPDMWWENQRITFHISIVQELRKRGYELRNTIIWDRRNIVNNIGIFGWPSNYITMGTTFEYLLDFWKPPRK